jgi:gamma-glutamylcyclotransferase (GGCT)/AIG2-like uncharacterized protein YtfP
VTRRYFAYGSNLCAKQMTERCPAARERELVALPGWRFIINRRGVATLVPDAEEQVWGLVWHLTPACQAALDRYECVARGVYRRVEVEVGGEPALIYLAAEEQPRAPRKGYLEGIVNACELRGVDAQYRERLERWAGPASPAQPSWRRLSEATVWRSVGFMESTIGCGYWKMAGRSRTARRVPIARWSNSLLCFMTAAVWTTVATAAMGSVRAPISGSSPRTGCWPWRLNASIS